MIWFVKNLYNYEFAGIATDEDDQEKGEEVSVIIHVGSEEEDDDIDLCIEWIYFEIFFWFTCTFTFSPNAFVSYLWMKRANSLMFYDKNSNIITTVCEFLQWNAFPNGSTIYQNFNF